MCYQVLELYSACRCLYYQHAVDRCPRYGKRGHSITQRTILVGYACFDHSSKSDKYSSQRDDHSYADSGYASRSSNGAQSRKTATPAPKSQRQWQNQTRRNRAAHTGLETPFESPTSDRTTEILPGEHPSSITVAEHKSSPNATTETASAQEVNARPERGKGSGAPPTETTLEEHTPSFQPRDSSRRTDAEIEDRSSIDWDAESEESSSEGTVASDAETIISIASSTTTVNSDATEAIFRRLLLFQDLRYLWPQLISRSVSKKTSVLTIERLLRRYSEDLSHLAACKEGLDDSDSWICSKASHFVRRSRLNIAHRIWEAYHDSEDDCIEVVEDTEELVETKGGETAGGFDDKSFIYEVSERFLFDTEPILALQASLKGLVASQQAEGRDRYVSLYASAEVRFSNMFSRLHNPPLKLGYRRLKWTCVSHFFSHFLRDCGYGFTFPTLNMEHTHKLSLGLRATAT